MSLTAPAPSTPSTTSLLGLRGQVAGSVVTADDAAYDAARAAWNRAFDPRPAVIVEAVDAADVAAAVRFAMSEGLEVAVQATGHGLTGTPDGGLVVSTHRMDGFTVDAATRTARLEAGVTWGPVLAEAQQHGLAPLVGSSPHVGAVGYTLGGGMGWLAREHGLASGTVRGFELVTADGELRRASADEHPELFWALRGAGMGAFGIVTAMEIELVPVTQVYAGNLLYPVEQAAEVFARYRDWVQDVPDELTSAVAIMHYPPLEEVPAPVRGRSFAIVRGCWCGPLAAGEELLRPWRDWQEPSLDLFGPMPFAQMAAISQDPVDPLPAVVTTDSLPDLDAATAQILIRATMPTDGPPPLLFTEVRHGGGALNAAPGLVGGSAYQDVAFISHAVGLVDPAAPAPAMAHAAALHDELAGHRSRHAYLNFLDGDDRRDRAQEAFQSDEWARLQAVKAEVDPTGSMAYGLPLSGA